MLWPAQDHRIGMLEQIIFEFLALAPFRVCEESRGDFDPEIRIIAELTNELHPLLGIFQPVPKLLLGFSFTIYFCEEACQIHPSAQVGMSVLCESAFSEQDIECKKGPKGFHDFGMVLCQRAC